MTALTTLEIQTFLNETYKAGRSPKTVKHIRDCLRAALNVAVNDWSLLPRNPASKARPPDPTRREMKVFDLSQAREFIAAIAGHRLEALFSLALCLGPRQGEVLGLEWRNLDLDAGRMMIDGALKRERRGLAKEKTKTESSVRTIALPAVVVAALRRRQVKQQQEREIAGSRWIDTPYVFTTLIGTPIERRNLLRDWYRIMAAAPDLPRIRFHDLRHSAATLLFAMGVHPKTVMEILGHCDLRTTMKIYGHVISEMKAEAASKMDQIFQQEPGENEIATNLATKAAHVKVN